MRRRWMRPAAALLTALIILVSGIPAYAEGNTRIIISNKDPQVGDSVSVEVRASESGSMTLSYDPSVLQVASVSGTDAASSGNSVTFTGTSGSVIFTAATAGTSSLVVSSDTLSGSSTLLSVHSAENAAIPDQTQQTQETTQGNTDYTVDGTAYTLSERFSDSEVPAGFAVVRQNIHNYNFKVAQNSATGMTLVYLKPASDLTQQGSFFVYQASDDTVTPFVYIGSLQQYVIPQTADSLFRDDLIATQVTAGSTSCQMYQIPDDSSGLYYVYGTDQTGTTQWYQYDSQTGSVQRINPALLASQGSGTDDASSTSTSSTSAAESESTSSDSTEPQQEASAGFLDRLTSTAAGIPVYVLAAVLCAVIVLIIIIIAAARRSKRRKRSAETDSYLEPLDEPQISPDDSESDKPGEDAAVQAETDAQQKNGSEPFQDESESQEEESEPLQDESESQEEESEALQDQSAPAPDGDTDRHNAPASEDEGADGAGLDGTESTGADDTESDPFGVMDRADDTAANEHRGDSDETTEAASEGASEEETSEEADPFSHDSTSDEEDPFDAGMTSDKADDYSWLADLDRRHRNSSISTEETASDYLSPTEETVADTVSDEDSQASARSGADAVERSTDTVKNDADAAERGTDTAGSGIDAAVSSVDAVGRDTDSATIDAPAAGDTDAAAQGESTGSDVSAKREDSTEQDGSVAESKPEAHAHRSRQEVLEALSRKYGSELIFEHEDDTEDLSGMGLSGAAAPGTDTAGTPGTDTTGTAGTDTAAGTDLSGDASAAGTDTVAPSGKTPEHAAGQNHSDDDDDSEPTFNMINLDDL